MELSSLIFFVGLINIGRATAQSQQDVTYRMPAEWEPHQRTFMCFPRSTTVWVEYLKNVQRDVARLANAIIEFEHVVMFVDPDNIQLAKELLDPRVEVVEMEVDDLWARDTLPVFISKIQNERESLTGVVFNFNGWGGKQKPCDRDAKLAKNVIRKFDLDAVTAQIIAEGGSFETDGKGTLLVTKSSLVNENRNNQTIDEIEMEMKRCLGVKKVIWLQGVYDRDITDAHVDCAVRFVRPGVVVVNRPFPGDSEDCWSKASDEAISVLRNSLDADGKQFKIIELFEPNRSKVKMTGDQNKFLTSYVNFLIGNGFVAIPAFGDDESDLKAQQILQEQFPDRKIVPVSITTIASGGGGIHCATHDQPAIKLK